jgi:hypothetical protein
MEKCAFTKACLSHIRVIMMIMRILVVDLLCQMTMGWPSVLEYLLSDARGCLWPCFLCQALNVIASREPCPVGAYPMLKSSEHVSWEPGYVLCQGN